MNSDDSQFDKKRNIDLDIEAEIEHEKEKYFLGLRITDELKESGIEIDNFFEMDNFFEGRPPEHIESFAFYQEYLMGLEKSLTRTEHQGGDALQVNPDILVAALAKSQQPQYSEEENPTLDKLLLLWEKAKESSMAKSSFSEYRRETRFFVRVLTEYNGGKSPRTAEINVAMIQRYRDVFAKIPKFVKTLDKTIDQLTSMSGEKKSKPTIKDTYQKVGGFINWSISKGCIVKHNIHDVLTYFEKIPKDERKHREPFDDDDLNKLFISKRNVSGKVKRASEYWVPILALYSGGSLSELVQLYTEDVYKDESGYWVVNINDKDDKRLKTDDGRPRVFPIHPMLKKLGFIKFVDFRKKRNEKKLFPCEKRNKRDRFGAFSNRFRNYRDKVGAGPREEKELRDFHSFRHLVRTKLAELGKIGRANERFNEGLVDDIIGHTSSERSMGKKSYTHTDLVQAKYNALKRLQYNLDFSKIASWDSCEFYRKEFRKN